MSYFLISAPESAYKYNKTVLERIKNISMPLSENFGIQLVTYRRFFNNGDLLHLSNSQEWLDHSSKYSHWTSHSTLTRIAETPSNDSRTYVWEKYPNSNDNVYGALYDFGFFNGATIYEKNANSVEVWAFSGGKDNPDSSLVYTTYFYILKRFMQYFQDKAKDILDTTDRSKIIPGDPQLLQVESHEKSQKIDKFIKETQINKYFLKGKERDFILSKREAQWSILFISREKS